MYELIKALHIISVISWMAGLLYLPRLMAYHCDAAPGGELDQTLKVMERRLYRLIMNPAMMASWIFGLWLASGFIGWSYPWLHAKLALVMLMTGTHVYLGRQVKRFAQNRNTNSKRFYKLINELPAILLVGIVLLVVMKPF